MSRPPRYAPKSQYRTRQSAGEVDAIDDNSATTIDRMVPDLEALERQYGPRREPAAEEAAAAPAPKPKSNLVIALAVALGLAIVAIAALGTFVVILLAR